VHKKIFFDDQSNSSDVKETDIRTHMPKILDILLIDRTKSTPSKIKNIIWANDNYLHYGASKKNMYQPTYEILPDLISGAKESLIRPRALKSKELQKERTKTKAEVFTPIWVVKMQNDIIDENFKDDDLETYINRKWLEITCGEGPYMVTRYHVDTDKNIETNDSKELIALQDRQGFIDRKLRRINNEIDDKADWQFFVELAFKSSYGFEWNGDSLLLARENLLYTYRDFYFEKWREEPSEVLFEKIAVIISYNVFQMDGLNYTIPLTKGKDRTIVQTKTELTLFGEETTEHTETIPGSVGKRVKIMNWNTLKMEYFDEGIDA